MFFFIYKYIHETQLRQNPFTNVKQIDQFYILLDTEYSI